MIAQYLVTGKCVSGNSGLIIECKQSVMLNIQQKNVNPFIFHAEESVFEQKCVNYAGF